MSRLKFPGFVPLASADEAQAQFYEALQHGDLASLMAVWADDEQISCVHPGGPRLQGPAAIRASFEALFANGAIDVRPEKVRRVSGPDCAVHSVLERVRLMTSQGPQLAWVIATNVYLKDALGWHMVAHHASPGVSQEAAESDEGPATLH